MAYKSQAPNPPSTTRSYDSFIQGWYDEVADWPAANVASYSSTGTTGTTGHYTQVSKIFLVAAKPTTLVETNSSSGLCLMEDLNLLTTNDFYSSSL